MVKNKAKIAIGIIFTVFLMLQTFSAQAAICFLPDCGDKTATPDTNQDAEKCKSEGYESYQNRVCHQYSIIEFCPYNSNYIKCNNKAWCTINDYTITECEPPTELFNKCPNGEEMYKECQLNMEEACLAEDPTYVSTCDAGWVIDPNDHCSLSDEFGHCCNTCPGFISKDELGDKTAVASCESCNGTKYIAADDGFNSCEGFWDCQDGCAPDAKTCISFGVVKCDKCKRCEAKCSNETCPENALCEYEACTWRYCDPYACEIGYTYFCQAPDSTDCATLGYTQVPTDCPGAETIKCPYNDQLVYCLPDDGSCCKICENYPIEIIPAGYVASESCTCCEKVYYKIKEDPCEGYSECTFGGAAGSTTCLSGTKTLYSTCKECPNACLGNTTCPPGTLCNKDECSGTYCPYACQTNYKNYCGVVQTNCQELGYIVPDFECADKDVLRCPYDSSWVMCVEKDLGDCCRNCMQLPFEGSLPAGYTQTDKCECCGKVYYDGIPNVCLGYLDCPFGGADGATTCITGDGTTLYSDCKTCPNACEGNTSCPPGSVCQYDSCSQTYCPTGCQTNYKNYCGKVQTNCQELGYIVPDFECSDKDILRCPYDSSWVMCVEKDLGDCCRNCMQLPFEGSLPSGYTQTDKCECCGKVYYDGVPNNCEGFLDCPYGKAEGAKTCITAEGSTLYSECKTCPDACHFDTCPTGSVCTKEDCSQKYCVTGCANSNYTLYCTQPETDCRALGYHLEDFGCTNQDILKCPYDTNWVICQDKYEDSSCNKCKHLPYTSVPDGYTITETCTCNGKNYYDAEISPCEKRGYTQKAGDCSNGYLACPYDNTKVYCR